MNELNLINNAMNVSRSSRRNSPATGQTTKDLEITDSINQVIAAQKNMTLKMMAANRPRNTICTAMI